MANIEHPIDDVIMDFVSLRKDMIAEFVEDDGVICDREAAILARFEIGKRRIKRVRALDRANTLAVKQEGIVTDYTRRQFSLAGLRVEPLDAA